MDKKKLSAVIFWVFTSLILALILFLALFNIEGFLEGKIRHALEPCSAVQVTIPRGKRLAIYTGTIDLLDIRARDFRRALTLRELNIRLSAIKIDPFRLAAGGLSAVRSLHGDGTVLVDEASLTAMLREKSPKFTVMSARLLPDIIQVQVITAFFEITLKGNLTIVEGTKIDFAVPESKDSSKKEKSNTHMLSLINPIFDVESMNLADRLLGRLPEKEKKKWEIRITELQVTKGLLRASFTVDKRP